MLFPNADVAINPIMLLLLGTILGTLSGFFGVGGGFLITGGLLVLGVPPLFAVGTGLTLIMGSSIINTLKHRELGNVDFKLGIMLLSGTLPAVFAAERLNTALEESGVAGPVIRYIYVVVLAIVGAFLIYDYLRTRRRQKEMGGQVSTAGVVGRIRSIRIHPEYITIPGIGQVPTYVSLPVSGIDRISVFIPFGIGAFVGFFAGLLGAGGGFILMPVLIYVLGVPTLVAIGTDLFQVIVTGSLGTFLYSLSDHVDPMMALIMLVAASAGSQLGATATRFVDASRIRVLYGVTVLSGSVAVALEQASKAGENAEFLSTIASVVLLGVSGAICLLIAVMTVAARRERLVKGSVEETLEGQESR